MAKMKSYPKAPKQSASKEVWARHVDKCKEVDKFNAQIEKDKTAKKGLIAQAKKLKAKR